MRRLFSPLFCLIAASVALAQQDSQRQLVLDERVIAATEGVELIQGAVAKYPNNPLFQADQPWENSLNNGYPNIVYDATDERFKLWYKCVLADKDAIAKLDPPRTVHDVGWLLCYATSRDGVTWDRPNLGLHSFAGSTANNAVTRDTPNVGVFRDTNPACPSERRFKMVFDVGLGKIHVRFSPDGIHWGEPIPAEGLGARSGDTHNNAFWDERLKKYVLITRLVLGERLVARAESEDFVHWSPATLVLRSNIDEGKKRQTYCMPSFPYGAGYLGFVMMYNVSTDKSVDCELVWSPDSLHWRRPFAGKPFIPRGAEGTYDAKCIYAQAGPPVLKGGKLHLYYGGDDYPHIGWKRHCLPCLATLRPDGFAGYRAAETGTVTTNPLRMSGDKILVTADAAGGSLVAELFAGDKLLAASEPIVADVSDEVLKWRDGFDLSSVNDRAVRLRFRLNRATMFAFHGLTQLPMPVVSPEVRRFDQQVEVALTAPNDAEIRYTLDGSAPSAASPRYETPFTFDRSVDLKAVAITAAGVGPVTTAAFVRREPWGRPKNPVEVGTSFTSDTEGWKGLNKDDKTEHRTDGGAKDGYIRLARAGATPYLSSADSTFAGDWPARFGGSGVRIVFQQRVSPASPRSTIELFANDVAQWSFSRLPAASDTWSEAAVTIRHDWSDAEAHAAGWVPASNAFSWRETIRHVGRVTLYPHTPAEGGAFELDEFRVTTVFEP